MRFPLRLTADLGLGLAGQALRGKVQRQLILRLASMEEVSRPLSSENFANGQRSVAEILSGVRDCPAPVVWISGAEPLLHPEVARLTRSIVECARHVFLQTNGSLVRRRIHEFQPVPRFFLAVEFHGMEATHDLRAGREGAFHAAVEGARTARLSGFHTCAYTAMNADTSLDELKRLREYLRTLDVDGWVISPACVPESAASRKSEAARQKLLEARQLIPSSRWRLLSELVGQAAPTRDRAAAPAHGFTRKPELRRDTCEEGAQAP